MTGQRITRRQWKLLQQVDLIAPEVTFDGTHSSSRQSNLLTLLRSAGDQVADTPGRSRNAVMLRRLRRELAAYSADCNPLRWHLPFVSAAHSARWFGDRLVWMPRTLPDSRRVAIVSSRLGRPLDTRRRWFATFRQFCRSLDRDAEVLLTVDKTATDRFVKRAVRLFDLPLISVHVARDRQTVASWLVERLGHSADVPAPDPSTASWQAWISPPLAGDPMADRALQDRVAICTAEQICACRVRDRGLLQELLSRRLRAIDGGPKPRVVIAVGAQLTPTKVASQLAAIGAKTVEVAEPLPTRRRNRPQHSRLAATVLTIAQLAGRPPYLIHWTRHQVEPWPDQTAGEYLDSLILQTADADHSALATLRRILEQQRILASSRAIRGGYSVVSFANIGLDELTTRRTYRAHRTRWDFEPYGIGIDRQWLQQQCTQPVRYGQAAEWETLPHAEQPYFQTVHTLSDRSIDWSEEREWRHCGDLDLTPLAVDQSFAFVPSRAEAELLADVSPWPIVVVASSAGQ